MEIHGPGNVSGPDPIQPTNRIQKAYQQPQASARPTEDSVEISELAQFKAKLDQVPDIRLDKVESLRQQIEAGTYETDDKISDIVDQIIDDLS